MKFNITTLLLTMILVAGFTTKSDAQDWRWRRYGHCPYADTASFEHCGRWGYAPRRFYRRMMWCNGDTAMCHRWAGRPWRWGMYENWREASGDFEKYHQEMEARWKKYDEEMKKDEKEFHEHWKDDRWDGDYGWRRWHRRWYDDYYYRGGGR